MGGSITREYEHCDLTTPSDYIPFRTIVRAVHIEGGFRLKPPRGLLHRRRPFTFGESTPIFGDSTSGFGETTPIAGRAFAAGNIIWLHSITNSIDIIIRPGLLVCSESISRLP
jgi:hypothetical protein